MTGATVQQRKTVLRPGEGRSIGGMAFFIAALHIAGWGTLILLVVPAHYRVGTQMFGAGLGATAYVLGARHAFDADHIAAIDNTTRKLLRERPQRPLSVGFWFSLGHSSIVFILCLLLSLGVRALAGQVSNGGSALHSTTGLIGTLISGVFLMLIGAINLASLVGIVAVFRRLRRGHFDEAELEETLDKRGFINRILGPIMRAISRPWQMYLVGLLFGLGFDTATEVSLLVIASGAAAFALPWYAIMTLPVLFAAGMSLLDTIDSCFMNFAYGWAFARPVRKLYYNITITGLSVAVAFIIGGIEILSLIADRFGLNGGVIGWIAHLDLNYVGYAIVGLFVLTWAFAIGIWRFARLEERWSTAPRPTEASFASAVASES